MPDRTDFAQFLSHNGRRHTKVSQVVSSCLQDIYLYYWNNFPVLVSLVTTIFVAGLLFIRTCSISPTAYSNSSYFIYYQKNLNLYKLLAGVHIKPSLCSRHWRHWEFLINLPNMNSFFLKYFAFKINSQHEPHQKRHVTDSTCGVWAGSRELKKKSSLFLSHGMCRMYMWPKLTSGIWSKKTC